MLISKLQINPEAIDASAVMVTFVGYAIVFLALITLFCAFYFLPKILSVKIKVKSKSKHEITDEIQETEIELSGEVNAAISMALYLHFNQYHDEESRNMTIRRESRLYSPWSSKIYQVRNQFNRL